MTHELVRIQDMNVRTRYAYAYILCIQEESVQCPIVLETGSGTHAKKSLSKGRLWNRVHTFEFPKPQLCIVSLHVECNA